MNSRAHHDGQTRYHAGLAAEESVARQYHARGFRTLATRWRGGGGEIDLVMADDTGCVFVEVKQSRTHAQAAEHLSQGQVRRLFRAAESFLARQPRGLATFARFDVALVDAVGRIEVMENALMA